MGSDCKSEVGFFHIFTLILAHSLAHTFLTSLLFEGQREATVGTAYPGHSPFSFPFCKNFVIEEFDSGLRWRKAREPCRSRPRRAGCMSWVIKRPLERVGKGPSCVARGGRLRPAAGR